MAVCLLQIIMTSTTITAMLIDNSALSSASRLLNIFFTWYWFCFETEKIFYGHNEDKRQLNKKSAGTVKLAAQCAE